jgi:hypothetical protein
MQSYTLEFTWEQLPVISEQVRILVEQVSYAKLETVLRQVTTALRVSVEKRFKKNCLSPRALRTSYDRCR